MVLRQNCVHYGYGSRVGETFNYPNNNNNNKDVQGGTTTTIFDTSIEIMLPVSLVADYSPFFKNNLLIIGRDIEILASLVESAMLHIIIIRRID